VREACTALGVSPSGFYAQRYKGTRLRRREDRTLADELCSAFDDSRGTYGSPRLVRTLRGRGFYTSKTRVRRLASPDEKPRPVPTPKAPCSSQNYAQ
jgi:putative transposase